VRVVSFTNLPDPQTLLSNDLQLFVSGNAGAQALKLDRRRETRSDQAPVNKTPAYY
jgi:hypothetical protein